MPLGKMDSKHIKGSLFALFIVFGLYCILGGQWGVEQITFQRALSLKASAQIDEAIQKNLVVFAAVSAIKAAAAVIEGSSLGVGFDLELGDLVQPAYDYIDFVWRMFLYAVLVLTFYKLLVESGILGLGIQVAGVGLILWGLAVLWADRQEKLRLWARRCFLLGVLIAYGVPAILVGSNLLSSRYTAPLKEQTAQKIFDAEQEFSQAKDDFLSLKDKISLTRPRESVENVRTALLEVVDKATSAAWKSVKVFLYYISILLFELLVLPILMVLLIYAFLHFALGRMQGRIAIQKQP